MVCQSTDFATRLHLYRDVLEPNEVASYEGAHFDAWWPREAAARKGGLSPSAIQPCSSPPLTILAVDAPVMRGCGGYNEQQLQMLAKKIFLIFQVAEMLKCPRILSGLLGGGAFRGNRPLVLLLHLLLQPMMAEEEEESACQLHFHNPIFWSFSGLDIPLLEDRVLTKADEMLERLRMSGVMTVRQALDELLTWNLPLNRGDADLETAGARTTATARTGWALAFALALLALALAMALAPALTPPSVS